MPLHWTISHPQRLILAVAKGRIGMADVQPYIDAVARQGAHGYRKIFDVTHAPDALGHDNLQEIARQVRVLGQTHRIGPLAIVAASDESYGLARYYAREASVDRPLQIFRELHMARQWLDAQADAVATPTPPKA